MSTGGPSTCTPRRWPSPARSATARARASAGNLGICRFSLGEYRQAIDLHTQALAIARDIGDRYLEANALDYLGRAWLASGDARQAVTLLGQAVSIADATGDIEPAVEPGRGWRGPTSSWVMRRRRSP